MGISVLVFPAWSILLILLGISVLVFPAGETGLP